MPEYPFTDEGLRDALVRLGRRQQKVHRTLRKHGCLGDPTSCTSCPVAMWLRRQFGTDYVTVEEGWAVLTRDLLVDEGAGRYYEATQAIRALVPQAVLGFIAAFDAQQYPDLIKVHPKEPPA